jgi:hypothetical protein
MWEKVAQKIYAGYFCNFQKLPKVNNHPLGENSPNLVNLKSMVTQLPRSQCQSGDPAFQSEPIILTPQPD